MLQKEIRYLNSFSIAAEDFSIYLSCSVKPLYRNCTADTLSAWALPCDQFVCSYWECGLWENHALWWDLIQGTVVSNHEVRFYLALRGVCNLQEGKGICYVVPG